MTANVATNLCWDCGRELEVVTATHAEERSGTFFLIENVPSKICWWCGESWMAESVLQKIDALIGAGQPIRTVETPVYDFARAD